MKELSETARRDAPLARPREAEAGAPGVALRLTVPAETKRPFGPAGDGELEGGGTVERERHARG